MEHECFYISGTHFEPSMGVYGGWVTMDGSFADRQAFFNEDRNIALIFSGECFLETEMGTQLKRKRHNLGRNKAEWLVHLYEEEGDRLFERLNGSFSGLLLDKRQRKAFLFNDRYGVERIYWHEKGGEFYFASEAKALLRVLPELRSFDEKGVAQFLTYGCTVEGRTLFRGVRLLPGASLWSFESGKCDKQTYFSPEAWESQPILSTEAFELEFQETFRRILPRYFESESKIGISLTAGLDSRMIMACRPEIVEEPMCYTFSGEKGLTLDDRLAARVAEACGLEHRLLRLGSDFFLDFAALADRTIFVTDGCLGILGAHEIYLNKQARQLAPVRLTGNYGSEVLRGVSTFKPIGLAPNLFNSEFSSSLDSLPGSTGHGDEHPVTFAAFREIPLNLFGGLAAGRSQTMFRTPYLDNEMVALAYRSPVSLRKSPRVALRLIKDNSAALDDIPTDRGFGGKDSGVSAVLKRLFSKVTFKLDYLYNEGLPHWLSPLDSLFGGVGSGAGILGLHKYLHYRSWFRRELAEYVTNVATDPRTRRMPFWNSEFLDCIASEHIRGRKNYVLEINAVLTLEAVERLVFRDLPYGLGERDEFRSESVPANAVKQA